MRSLHFARFPASLAFVVASFGCTENGVLTPRPRLAPPSTSQPTMAALPPFNGDVDHPGWSTLVLPTFDYPEGVRAVITVTGSVSVESDIRAHYFQEDVDDLGPGGIWIDGGYKQCSLGIVITYGAASFPGPACNPWDVTTEWTFTAVLKGAGKATRNASIPLFTPGVCDTVTCHSYSGKHTVLVSPIAGDLDVSAKYHLENRIVRKSLFIKPFTNSVPYAYQLVTFADSTLPRGLPMKALSHAWTMADPTYPPGYWNHTQVPAACLGSAAPIECPVQIRETGIWESTVRVNGMQHTDSLTVYCAESDSLMNKDLVRQGLLAALDSSDAWLPSHWLRKERGFLVVMDTVTPGAEPRVMVLPPGLNNDPCNGNPVMPTPSLVPANTKILAWGHSHPLLPDETTLCRPLSGQGLEAFTLSEGGSEHDRSATDNYNNPVLNPTAHAAGWLPMPSIVINKKHVYILRPGGTLGSELAAGNKFNWDGLNPTEPLRTPGRCKWPKRII